MSNIRKDFNGVSNDSVRSLVKKTYMLHESAQVKIEFLYSYPRNDGAAEYEFKAIFECKDEWHDDGIVEKFITVSIRDNY